MYLHGNPFEDAAGQSHLSQDRAQSPTNDIPHWGKVTSAEGQSVHDGDNGYSNGLEQGVETAGSTLSRAMRSVGWCTICASHSCWCLPQQDDEILSCSPSSLSSDLIHSLTC
jgi:hypothetical protein